MTDWYDILKSPLFEESSETACCTKIIKALEDSLPPHEEQNRGYSANLDNSWDDFCSSDSTENAIELPKSASFTSSLGRSPAHVPSTYTRGLQYNGFSAEHSWEPYGDATLMDLAVPPDGKQPQPTRTDELGQDLASWFGNLTNLPRLSPPSAVSPAKSERQGSSGCAIVDDPVSDSGTFDKSSPSTVFTNRSGSLTWSLRRSTSSTSSTEDGEDELKVQNDFQASSASRRGKRKSSSNCSHSKHDAQVERTRAANRAAAHRYREKRRAATEALESRVKVLEAENRSLNSTIGTLHTALLSLRVEILRHGACGDDRVV